VINTTTKNTKDTKKRIEFDQLSNQVIGCAIEVHREIGPGLLESTYEQCLAYELKNNGFAFKVQHPLLVIYKNIRLDCGYRVDLLVENKLIIELKSVDAINKIHEAQILTYMKLAGIETGLLISFNVGLLKNGIRGCRKITWLILRLDLGCI
jgi:GxxExxY protein